MDLIVEVTSCEFQSLSDVVVLELGVLPFQITSLGV
jgi:hypothetical protein